MQYSLNDMEASVLILSLVMSITSCLTLHGMKMWLVDWWRKRVAFRPIYMLHSSSTIATLTHYSPVTLMSIKPLMLTSPLTISFLRCIIFSVLRDDH
jgi:hypothetical protein